MSSPLSLKSYLTSPWQTDAASHKMDVGGDIITKIEKLLDASHSIQDILVLFQEAIFQQEIDLFEEKNFQLFFKCIKRWKLEGVDLEKSFEYHYQLLKYYKNDYFTLEFKEFLLDFLKQLKQESQDCIDSTRYMQYLSMLFSINIIQESDVLDELSCNPQFQIRGNFLPNHINFCLIKAVKSPLKQVELINHLINKKLFLLHSFSLLQAMHLLLEVIEKDKSGMDLSDIKPVYEALFFLLDAEKISIKKRTAHLLVRSLENKKFLKQLMKDESSFKHLLEGFIDISFEINDLPSKVHHLFLSILEHSPAYVHEGATFLLKAQKKEIPLKNNLKEIVLDILFADPQAANAHTIIHLCEKSKLENISQLQRILKYVDNDKESYSLTIKSWKLYQANKKVFRHETEPSIQKKWIKCTQYATSLFVRLNSSIILSNIKIKHLQELDYDHATISKNLIKIIFILLENEHSSFETKEALLNHAFKIRLRYNDLWQEIDEELLQKSKGLDQFFKKRCQLLITLIPFSETYLEEAINHLLNLQENVLQGKIKNLALSVFEKCYSDKKNIYSLKTISLHEKFRVDDISELNDLLKYLSHEKSATTCLRSWKLFESYINVFSVDSDSSLKNWVECVESATLIFTRLDPSSMACSFQESYFKELSYDNSHIAKNLMRITLSLASHLHKGKGINRLLNQALDLRLQHKVHWWGEIDKELLEKCMQKQHPSLLIKCLQLSSHHKKNSSFHSYSLNIINTFKKCAFLEEELKEIVTLILSSKERYSFTELYEILDILSKISLNSAAFAMVEMLPQLIMKSKRPNLKINKFILGCIEKGIDVGAEDTLNSIFHLLTNPYFKNDRSFIAESKQKICKKLFDFLIELNGVDDENFTKVSITVINHQEKFSELFYPSNGDYSFVKNCFIKIIKLEINQKVVGRMLVSLMNHCLMMETKNSKNSLRINCELFKIYCELKAQKLVFPQFVEDYLLNIFYSLFIDIQGSALNFYFKHIAETLHKYKYKTLDKLFSESQMCDLFLKRVPTQVIKQLIQKSILTKKAIVKLVLNHKMKFNNLLTEENITKSMLSSYILDLLYNSSKDMENFILLIERYIYESPNMEYEEICQNMVIGIELIEGLMNKLTTHGCLKSAYREKINHLIIIYKSKPSSLHLKLAPALNVKKCFLHITKKLTEQNTEACKTFAIDFLGQFFVSCLREGIEGIVISDLIPAYKYIFSLIDKPLENIEDLINQNNKFSFNYFLFFFATGLKHWKESSNKKKNEGIKPFVQLVMKHYLEFILKEESLPIISLNINCFFDILEKPEIYDLFFEKDDHDVGKIVDFCKQMALKPKLFKEFSKSKSLEPKQLLFNQLTWLKGKIEE